MSNIGEGQDWLDGIAQAWRMLTSLNPETVCRRARVEFDGLAGSYVLPLFNEKVYVSLRDKCIRGDSKLADLVLNRLPHYSLLPILWYLIQAQDIPLSDKLISPREVKGGLIFTRGTHMLPLDKLAEQYGDCIERFVEKGIALGGEPANHGDASVRLCPFPRVPVVLLIWKNDDEFPARANILLDSTCTEHLPTDIIWSTAMLSILVML